MIFDALLIFSDAQALTGTGAVSANAIDLGNPTVKRDIGAGEPLTLACTVEVALAGTTPTLLVEATQSDNADLSSPDVVASSGVFTGAAAAPAGLLIEVPLGEGRITKRYLGARYTLGGTTATATVSCALQPWSMASLTPPRHYAKGYAV